jgi:hypothetical protein
MEQAVGIVLEMRVVGERIVADEGEHGSTGRPARHPPLHPDALLDGEVGKDGRRPILGLD